MGAEGSGLEQQRAWAEGIGRGQESITIDPSEVPQTDSFRFAQIRCQSSTIAIVHHATPKPAQNCLG